MISPYSGPSLLTTASQSLPNWRIISSCITTAWVLTPFLKVWVIPVRFLCVVREFYHQCSPNLPWGAPAAGLVESNFLASVAVVSNNSYVGVSQCSGVLYNAVLFFLRWVHSATHGPKKF